MIDDIPSDVADRLNAFESVEERAVATIGYRIGYGRVMQLCERLWRERATAVGQPGSEHTIGPCASLMVECECPQNGRDKNGHCEWCCGSGRVTRLVGELQHTLEDVTDALMKVGALDQSG